MDWALIELPNPNSAEAKYKSQIPSPNNLLQVATALKQVGHQVKLYNFFRDRYPPIVEADAYVLDIFPCTCMDYYADYAIGYLNSMGMFLQNKEVWLTGFYPWLHKSDMPHNVADPTYFDNSIAGVAGDFHNDWDAFDSTTIPAYKDGHRRITIRASRGCPHQCRMCPVALTYHGVVRRYPVGWVLDEIEELHKRGVWDIGFLDDNLFSDHKWAKTLLGEMITRQYKKRGMAFTFEEGLDVPTALNEEIVGKLKEAGFYRIKLGVETFQKESLEYIRKPYRDPEMAKSAIRLLKSYGLSPTCFQIIGLPTQTLESVTQDIGMFKELGVKIRAQILWEYPGVSFHPSLSAQQMKELCHLALEQTGSLTWKHRTKS